MGLVRQVIQAVKSAVGIGTPNADTPSAAQDALNERLNAMVEAGHAYAEPFAPMKETGLRYACGDQLSDAPDMPNGWIPVVDNQIGPLLAQERAIMSQYVRRIVTTALKPEQAPQVKIAGQALNWIFSKGLKVNQLLLRAMMDGQTGGEWVTALWADDSARWNKQERKWDWRLRCDLLTPGCFYADGVAETPEDWRYAYTFRLVPLGEALQRWPEFRDKIIDAALKESEQRQGVKGNGISGRLLPNQPAGEYKAKDTSKPLNMSDRARLVDALNYSKNPTLGERTKDNKKLPGYVSVLEPIFEDDEMKTVENMVEEEEAALLTSTPPRLAKATNGERLNPDTGEAYADDSSDWPKLDMSYQAPKYPYGRHVIRFGVDTIVHDKPWPYEHWLWDIGLREMLPHTWHGKNAIEDAKDAQDLNNQLRAGVVNYLRNHAHCERVIEEDTLIGGEDLENVGEQIAQGPDKITKIHAGKSAGYRLLPPPPLPAGLAEMVDKVAQALRDTIGIQTIEQGRGNSKTLGQDVLNEAKSRLRTALMSMLMDDYVVRLMEHAWEICKAKWSENPDTFIRIIGQGGKTEGVQLDPLMLEAEFEIGLEVTTATPFERERRKQDSIQLFQLLLPLGLAGYVVNWLLDAWEVPDADELKKELAKTAQAQPQPTEPGQPGQPTPQGAPLPQVPGAMTQGMGAAPSVAQPAMVAQ